MKLKQIETFYWAAKLGSFAKAAMQLHATHSAVSMRILELEAGLGVRLFDRSQRAAKLTSDGVHLLKIAEQMLVAADEMLQFKSNRKRVSGYIRLGVVETVAMTWLPVLIERVKREYPHVQIELEVALSHVLEDKLQVGALDIIFAPCILSAAKFCHTDLGAVHFAWMCSPKAGVPQRVTVRELEELPLIVTSREQQFRGTLLEWVIRCNVKLKRPHICNTFVIAERLVAANLGIGYLPCIVYREDIEAGRLVQLQLDQEPGPMRHFSIRPLNDSTPLHMAIEDIAMAVSTFVR